MFSYPSESNHTRETTSMRLVGLHTKLHEQPRRAGERLEGLPLEREMIEGLNSNNQCFNVIEQSPLQHTREARSQRPCTKLEILSYILVEAKSIRSDLYYNKSLAINSSRTRSFMLSHCAKVEILKAFCPF